jgi:hypothetical protein
MSPLAQTIADELRATPRQFSEVVDQHRNIPWPEFLKAWGEIRGLATVGRDESGRYMLKDG